MTNQAPDKTTQGTTSRDYDEWPTPALLRAARDTYRKAIHKRLVDGGFADVPRDGSYVLGAIINHGVAPGDAMRLLGVTKQAASQLLDTLVLRGYLERTTDTADRRRMIVEPTERGRAAATAVRAGVAAIDDQLTRRLSPGDRAALQAGLGALIEIGVGEGEDPATSPTRLIQFSPIFPVRDLRRALDHYRGLGFSVKAYGDGDEYGFADRSGIGIHLVLDRNLDPHDGGSEAYLYVEDADSMFAEWSRPGIGGRTLPVGDMAYKLREGTHIDPDNNVIRFGSKISTMTPDSRG
ncbi:MAG: MarR family transcriptional regulator [Thaumarchaeota archaeon]|nr:MarR family transcriptional regulator [Nitrososphaerota archaeon]